MEKKNLSPEEKAELIASKADRQAVEWPTRTKTENWLEETTKSLNITRDELILILSAVKNHPKEVGAINWRIGHGLLSTLKRTQATIGSIIEEMEKL